MTLSDKIQKDFPKEIGFPQELKDLQNPPPDLNTHNEFKNWVELTLM